MAISLGQACTGADTGSSGKEPRTALDSAGELPSGAATKDVQARQGNARNPAALPVDGDGTDALPAEDLRQVANYSEPPRPLSITGVDLGTGLLSDNSVASAGAQFAPRDTVYASVATDGAASGADLAARWIAPSGEVFAEDHQTLNVRRAARTEFHVSHPSGWPSGRYRLEISLSGVPGPVREFSIP